MIGELAQPKFTRLRPKRTEDKRRFWREARELVAKCVLAAGGSVRVSLLPTFIGPMSQPEILNAGDPRFAEVCAYLEKHTSSQGLNARYAPSGDELLLDAPQRCEVLIDAGAICGSNRA